MPLSDIQRAILCLLARNRDPESFVAGAVPLQQDGPRYSSDIDIFHDREERVAAVPDPLFGYRLHVVEIATNKALAAAGRQAPRDVLDLLLIHERHLTLGAVIWAAVGKDPGYSPENLIAEIRRNARYRADDYEALATAEPIDAGAVSRQLKAALAEAEAFVRAMPSGKEGLVFLRAGSVVAPDPSVLAGYEEHPGRRGGYWPSSSEIGGSMLDAGDRPSLGND